MAYLNQEDFSDSLGKLLEGKTTPLLDSSGSLSVPELTPYSRHRRESKAIFS